MSELEHIKHFEESFLHVIRKMTTEWVRHMPASISRSQFLILKRLAACGPQKITSLAEALYITAGAVTGISDKLIEGGYAQRHRGEDDRRIVMLEITPLGIEFLAEIEEHKREMTRKYLEGFADEEILAMTGFFDRLIANIESHKKIRS